MNLVFNNEAFQGEFISRVAANIHTKGEASMLGPISRHASDQQAAGTPCTSPRYMLTGND